MTIFNDLFDWAESEPRRGLVNQVRVCMGAVYDKANPEETSTRFPDFAAFTVGMLRLEHDMLITRAKVTFSNRLIWIDDQTSETGQRDIWGVRLLRDGNVEVEQPRWRIAWRRLTSVQRMDFGGGDFAVGHFQNASTKALMSFSFDRVAVAPYG